MNAALVAFVIAAAAGLVALVVAALLMVMRMVSPQAWAAIRVRIQRRKK